jgi:hypothetical protein
MRRAGGRVISIVLLLALGLALSSLALGPGYDPPGHFDGDQDDAGLIWRTLSQCADIPVIGTLLTFIPWAPTECVAPSTPVGPGHVAREPHGSRAPLPGRAAA